MTQQVIFRSIYVDTYMHEIITSEKEAMSLKENGYWVYGRVDSKKEYVKCKTIKLKEISVEFIVCVKWGEVLN